MKMMMMAAAAACIATAAPGAAQTIYISGQGVLTSAIGGAGPREARSSPFSFTVAYDYTGSGYSGPASYTFVETDPSFRKVDIEGVRAAAQVSQAPSMFSFMSSSFDPQFSAIDLELKLASPLTTALGSINLASGSTIQFNVERLALFGTVLSASVSAVPEPATWLLAFASIGVIGASLRRRRSRPDFATATCS